VSHARPWQSPPPSIRSSRSERRAFCSESHPRPRPAHCLDAGSTMPRRRSVRRSAVDLMRGSYEYSGSRDRRVGLPRLVAGPAAAHRAGHARRRSPGRARRRHKFSGVSLVSRTWRPCQILVMTAEISSWLTRLCSSGRSSSASAVSEVGEAAVVQPIGPPSCSTPPGYPTDGTLAAGPPPNSPGRGQEVRALAFYRCAGPSATPLRKLIRVAGARWAIEECGY
jgi:hypothetical protein